MKRILFIITFLLLFTGASFAADDFDLVPVDTGQQIIADYKTSKRMMVEGKISHYQFQSAIKVLQDRARILFYSYNHKFQTEDEYYLSPFPFDPLKESPPSKLDEAIFMQLAEGSSPNGS